MKKLVITLTLAAAMLSSCTTVHIAAPAPAGNRDDISWTAFCDAHGYDRNDTSRAVINEYLDTWCGSADEEAALIRNGIALH